MNPALTRYSTTTCDVIGSSTVCITESPVEISYYDFITVSLWGLFLLSLFTFGFYFSGFFEKGRDAQKFGIRR